MELPGQYTSEALADVALERFRQMQEEGWTVEHDDEHADGSLARVASAYAYFSSLDECDLKHNKSLGRITGIVKVIDLLWPQSWSERWWKPKDRRLNLVRAGALIVAEIERLDRAAAADAAA